MSPQNLNQVKEALDQIKRSAGSAQSEVARLRKELEQVLSAQARGLPPTRAGVTGFIQQAAATGGVPGTIYRGGGQFAAGGGRAPGIPSTLIPEETQRQIGPILTQIIGALIDFRESSKLAAVLSKEVASKEASLVGAVTGAAGVARPTITTGGEFARAPFKEQPVQADLITAIKERANINRIAARETQQNVAQEGKAIDDFAAALESRAAELSRGAGGRGRIPPTTGDLGEIPRAPGDGGRGRGRQPAPAPTQAELQSVLGLRETERLLERIQQSGFTQADIKRVVDYGNSYKVVQLEQRRTLEGTEGMSRVMRRLNLTMDQAGNIFTSTQKSFRTFFSAIQRNVSEMIKWSAATLLVWGTIRKLSELLQIAIKNETELANIAVILGRAHSDLGQIFEDAAEAAAATGESIDGVLEGYAQAYRATGNIVDATERARVSQQLLVDSLILSKLSALNQAQAMDTLTGALRQAGLGLDEGQVLLDKWVAVSRAANVGLDTLAESFAITATSASNAGLDIDELNGIIATIAEVTTLSASESGNAIRAFISGFTTDAAVRELSQFGIAVQDLNGDSRGFLEVMTQIAALAQAGIISDSELNKISRAIGGGARREAQVVAVIKNLGRAQEIAAVSADAQGEAEEALSIQLETVQTSITKLGNSFQVLARTMGDEGGVLNLTKEVLTVFEGLVSLATTLTRILGDLTPIVTALAVAFAATSKETRALLTTNLASQLSTKLPLLSGLLRPPSTTFEGGVATQDQGGRLFRPGIGGKFPLGGQALAGGFTAFSAIQDIRQGNVSGAVASVAGGVLGALATGGNPIGIIIGTAAGEAFANATINFETSFENFFTEIFRDASKKGVEAGVKETEDVIRDVFSGVSKEITGGLIESEDIGKFGSKVGSIAMSAILKAGAALKVPGFEGAVGITPEQFGLIFTGEEERERVRRLKEEQTAKQGFGAQPGQFQLSVVEQQRDLLTDYQGFLSNLEKVSAEEARAKALAGEINERELRSALEQIPKLQAITTQYFTTFGEGFQRLNPEIKSTEDAFRAFSDIVIGGSQEQIEFLNSLSNQIAVLQNQIDTARQAGEGFVFLDDPNIPGIDELLKVPLSDAEKMREELEDGAATFATTMETAMRKAAIQLPSIVTLDVRADDLERVFNRAAELQKEFISKTFEEGLNEGLTEEDIRSTFEPIMVQAGESGGFTYAQGFMQQFLAVAVEQMQAAGEILAPTPERIQLRPLDMTSAQFPAAMARYQQLASSIQQQLGAQGIEWSPDEETFAGLFTDFIAQPITADLTLLNLAMQDLIDIEKKQLEGVYNLPTDASFFVPFQGYRLGTGAGGAGGAGADRLISAGDNLKQAAASLERAAQLLAAEGGQDVSRRTDAQSQATLRRTINLYAAEFGMQDVSKRPENIIPFTSIGTQQRVTEFPPPQQPQRIPPSPLYGPRPIDTGNQNRLFNAIEEAIRKAFEGVSVEDIIRMSLIQGAIVPTGVPTGERETRPRFDTEIPLTAPTGTEGDLLQTIRQFFINMFSELQSPGISADVAKAGGLPGGVATGNIFEKMNSVFDLLSQKIQNLSGFSTSLRINSTTTTNLIVDGRTLANIVKPYLYEDMIRFEESSSSISKNIVV